MKNSRNNWAVVGILLLLGLGYFVPPLALAVEDVALRQEAKKFEIDEIQLNNTTVEIVEQLSVFSDMMFEHIVIEMDSEQSSSDEKEEVNNDNNIQKSVYEFWKKFKDEDGPMFEKATYSNYIMMAGISNENVYSIWEYVGMDKQGNEFYFWIDDISGKVLAFEIPFSSIGYKENEYYSAMQRLSFYYGFSSYSFSDNITNFNKVKSWENGFVMYDKENSRKVELHVYKVGDRMYFNIYPGTKNLSTS